MRNDMSIQGVAPVAATSEQLPDSRNPRPSAPAPAPPSPPTPIYINPSLRLDPSLGLVVIEFRDGDGAVTNSIPTQRQLRAYKQHELSPGPDRPNGIASPSGVSGTGGSRAPPASAPSMARGSIGARGAADLWEEGGT